MMVTSTYAGKEIAYDATILPRLNVLLHEEVRFYGTIDLLKTS